MTILVPEKPKNIPSRRSLVDPMPRKIEVHELGPFIKYSEQELQEAEAQWSTNTHKTYRMGIKKLGAFCLERGLQPEYLTGDNIREYIRWLCERHTAKSVDSYLYCLKRFYCERDQGRQYITAIFSESKTVACRRANISHAKKQKPEKQAPPMTLDILAKLYPVIQQRRPIQGSRLENPVETRVRALHHWSLLNVMYSCGLRSAEAVDIEWHHLDYDDGTLTIPRSKTDQEGEGEVVKISPTAIDLVKEWYALCKPAIDDKVFPIGLRMMWNYFKWYSAEAGIEPHLTTHSPRRGLCQDMYCKGASISKILKQLRWANLTMFNTYTKGLQVARSGIDNYIDAAVGID